MLTTNTTLEMLMKSSDEKLLWTRKDVSTYLGVSLSTVSNYINAEENPLESIKLGSAKKSAIRIPIEGLASFIENLKNDSGAKK